MVILNQRACHLLTRLDLALPCTNMAAASKDLVGVISGITRVVGAGQAAVCSNLQYCTSNSATLKLLCRSFPKKEKLNTFAIDSEWTTHDLPAELRDISASKPSNTATSTNSSFVRSFHSFSSNKQRSFSTTAETTSPPKQEVRHISLRHIELQE